MFYCHVLPRTRRLDLRRFFGSSTLRNFFGLVYVSYVPGAEDEPLATIASKIQSQIASETEAPALKRRMNRMIKLEKNPFLRKAPLILKDAALRLAAKISARDATTTTSSLGVIQLPAATERYVNGISVLTSTSGINFVACTFQDNLCIGISSIYNSHRIVRNLVRILGDEGIHGVMNVSKNAAEVDAQLKQAALESRIMAISGTSISGAWEEERKDGKRQ